MSHANRKCDGRNQIFLKGKRTHRPLLLAARLATQTEPGGFHSSLMPRPLVEKIRERLRRRSIPIVVEDAFGDFGPLGYWPHALYVDPDFTRPSNRDQRDLFGLADVEKNPAPIQRSNDR